MVPTGTPTTTSLPRAPCWRLEVPCWPSVARRKGWSLNPSREAWLWSASSQTSPPFPPSPPSGPPFATWASRRKLTHPAPPSPALACSWAESTKGAMGQSYEGVSRHLLAQRRDGLVEVRAVDRDLFGGRRRAH